MAEPSKAGGRRLLLAGFGGLLLLMLVAGVDAIMVLREVRSSDAQERNLYSAPRHRSGPGPHRAFTNPPS